MSSANQKVPGEDTEDENNASVKIYDVSDSELFVLDEVGSDDPLNPTSEEDKPEVVFVKETSRNSNEDISEIKAKGNSDVNSAPDDDEPQIIFSSAQSTPIVPSSDLKQEGFTKTQDDEPETVTVSNSSDVTCPNSQCNPSQEITEDQTLLKENVSNDLIMEDVSGLFCLDTTPEVTKDKQLGPRFRRVKLFIS